MRGRIIHWKIKMRFFLFPSSVHSSGRWPSLQALLAGQKAEARGGQHLHQPFTKVGTHWIRCILCPAEGRNSFCYFLSSFLPAFLSSFSFCSEIIRYRCIGDPHAHFGSPSGGICGVMRPPCFVAEQEDALIELRVCSCLGVTGSENCVISGSQDGLKTQVGPSPFWVPFRPSRLLVS